LTLVKFEYDKVKVNVRIILKLIFGILTF